MDFFLITRMVILYPFFAWLGGTGAAEFVQFDKATDTVTIQFTLVAAWQAGAGLLGYVGTWWASRRAKAAGGAT
ncbi:hypothetical protein IQ03_04558 [Gemmobacter caeni]|uniref:Uncharacterized protein n=1 Tax=Gemmobacter caeni TaxID=589035 RepID=A0A2T5ZV96_9RHOB|nr:hypothetical protein [Gemmobacter caeni]PTX35474.1 hypothetical protein C8N34_1792 [Gemmobacter caeni]TWI90019.1 hypothetical protein IQ03_04983 [Gemmobacter caeni]TWI93797.1 hypothetical protein IQ03_04558 [Gemmobacter caeni]